MGRKDFPAKIKAQWWEYVNTRSSVKIDEERDYNSKIYNQWKEYEELDDD